MRRPYKSRHVTHIDTFPCSFHSPFLILSILFNHINFQLSVQEILHAKSHPSIHFNFKYNIYVSPSKQWKKWSHCFMMWSNSGINSISIVCSGNSPSYVSLVLVIIKSDWCESLSVMKKTTFITVFCHNEMVGGFNFTLWTCMSYHWQITLYCLLFTKVRFRHVTCWIRRQTTAESILLEVTVVWFYFNNVKKIVTCFFFDKFHYW